MRISMKKIKEAIIYNVTYWIFMQGGDMSDCQEFAELILKGVPELEKNNLSNVLKWMKRNGIDAPFSRLVTYRLNGHTYELYNYYITEVS